MLAATWYQIAGSLLRDPRLLAIVVCILRIFNLRSASSSSADSRSSLHGRYVSGVYFWKLLPFREA